MLGATLKPAIRGLVFTSLIILSACGGGGGSDGGTGGGGTTVTPVASASVAASSSTASFTANAGVDKTVNAGDRIDLISNALVVGATSFSLGGSNLELKGSSTTANDIVLVSWTKMEGPAIALGTNSLATANAFFTAPSTGNAASIQVIYKLTIAKFDGTKAEDSVTFTINRVNNAPTANAGADMIGEATTTVTLNATAADIDGTIAGYSWAQSAGQSVLLTSTSSAATSFTAPTVLTDTDLEFTLSVTDNNGATTTDKVIVRVTPKDAPKVEMRFPPVGGIFKGSKISAFGTATPINATLSSVTVTIGTTPVNATLDANGNWRVDDLVVPTGATEIKLQVVATDSLGRTGKAVSNLSTSANSFSDNLGMGKHIGLAIDSTKNLAYLLSTGNLLSDIKLFSVNLTTGKKGPVISSFADSTQGLDSSAITTMTYSAEKQLIYIATAPSDTSITKKIISINTITGQRLLISDDTKGSGANFTNPTGIALGNNNTIYVADNLNDTIVAVNVDTGNRTVIADNDSLAYGISTPLLLASDNSAASERLFILGNYSLNSVLQLNPLASPTINSLVTDSAVSAQGASLGTDPLGFVIDPKANQLYVAEFFGGIIKVDIATGKRVELLDTDAFRTRITYDSKNQLLYLLDGTTVNLYVVDPTSAQKVLISRSN